MPFKNSHTWNKFKSDIHNNYTYKYSRFVLNVNRPSGKLSNLFPLKYLKRNQLSCSCKKLFNQSIFTENTKGF